jgi:hypothetical protein
VVSGDVVVRGEGAVDLRSAWRGPISGSRAGQRGAVEQDAACRAGGHGGHGGEGW